MTAPANIALHGYQPLYHGPGERCPGCHSQHWHIGRMSAECARCGTALPLADVAAQPMQPRFTVTSSRTAYRFPRMQEDQEA